MTNQKTIQNLLCLLLLFSGLTLLGQGNEIKLYTNGAFERDILKATITPLYKGSVFDTLISDRTYAKTSSGRLGFSYLVNTRESRYTEYTAFITYGGITNFSSYDINLNNNQIKTTVYDFNGFGAGIGWAKIANFTAPNIKLFSLRSGIGTALEYNSFKSIAKTANNYNASSQHLGVAVYMPIQLLVHIKRFYFDFGTTIFDISTFIAQNKVENPNIPKNAQTVIVPEFYLNYFYKVPFKIGLGYRLGKSKS